MSKADSSERILALEARVRELEEELRTVGRKHDLTEDEEKLRLALSVMGLGLWSWDLRTQDLVWDDNMCKLHGGPPPPRADMYVDTFVPAEERDRIKRDTVGALQSDSKLPPQIMHRVMRGDGSVRWVLTTAKVFADPQGEPRWAVGGCIDATRQHELEEQVRSSQQMETVGSLTAGVAHNFNNMLAVILPTLELATELVPPERADLLRQATQAAGRASELVRQLMTYAGQSRASRHQPCRIVHIVETAVIFARRTVESHITVRVEIDPALQDAEVEGNPVQLEHVVVSLLLNARDAIIEADRLEGQILVCVRPSQMPLRTKLRPEPRAAVCVDVCDNGTGIPAALRPHLFEPFFTTKSRSQGTGLGLATSFGTMRDHGGLLECQPSPAVGAEFTLTLPLLVSQPQPQLHSQRPDFTPFPNEDLPVGTSVLLIDDDASVRGALGHVLHSLGLTVFEASCGPTAVGALRAHPEVEIILLDMTESPAPDAFVAKLKDIAPAARIVLLSGDAVEAHGPRFADAVVSKPVSSPLLIKTIRSVLEDAKQ